MTEQDEKPETVEETESAAEHTAETVNDVDEVAQKPEPEVKETTSEIPSWGQELIGRVDELAATVAAPAEQGIETAAGDELPEHGESIDETPIKEPWTSRPLGSLFGFK